jgi:hypothetical protein
MLIIQQESVCQDVQAHQDSSLMTLLYLVYHSVHLVHLVMILTGLVLQIVLLQSVAINLIFHISAFSSAQALISLIYQPEHV